MSDEAKKTDVQVVEQEPEKIVVTPKQLEQMVARAIVNVEKKDYRASFILNTPQQQLPDAMTEFVNIKEENQNSFGFNRDLDVKGTISSFQLWKNKLTRISVALSQLKDWRYVERQGEKEDEIFEEPIDLAQLAADEERFLTLSLGGLQSEKQIRNMRAGFGMNDETVYDKGAKWFGLVKKKKSEVYNQNPQE